MKKIIFFLLLLCAQLATAQQQWVKNTFPGQGHIDNPGPWKTGQGSDRGEWVSAFGVSPVIPPGDDAPLMLQVSDLATLQYSSDGKEFKRANIPSTRGSAVAFNPHDGNVGYALMDSDPKLGLAGWWRTEDKGETWSFMFAAPRQRGQRNDLLEVHPAVTFKDHIYVALSSGNDGDADSYQTGLYRSIDNGATWEVIDFLGEEILQIRFNSDGTVLYVVTHSGEPINRTGGTLYALTFDTSDPNNLAYTKASIRGDVRNMDASPSVSDEGVMLDINEHIYSFTDHGANITLLTDDFSNTSNSLMIFVEINPSNKDHIVCYGFGGLKFDPFIWTNDGGVTWNGVEFDDVNGTYPTWFDYAPINHASPNYVLQESPDVILDGAKDMLGFWPGNPSRVLQWGTNIQKGPMMSEDYGRTFKPFAHGGSFKATSGGAIGDTPGVIGLSRAEYGFVLTKNNGVTWEGYSPLNSPTLRTIYENHPNSRTFKKRNGNSLDFNPENNDIIIGSFGISPTHIVRSEDFGKTWTDLDANFQPKTSEIPGWETESATKVYWHNQNPDIVYVGSMKSTDGGLTFNPISGGHYVTGINEKNGDIVISYEFGRLIFISYDAGETWGKLPLPPEGDVSIAKFVVSAGTNGTAFDLRPEHDPAKGGRLRVLTGGQNGVYEFLADEPGGYTGTWTLLNTGFDFSDDPYITPGETFVLNYVSSDKREGHLSTMYATVGSTSGRRAYYQQVYKSTDAGNSWFKIASDDILGSPYYVSALWAEVDAEGNFIYSDWDGLYTYQGLATIDINTDFPDRGSIDGGGTFGYEDQVNLNAQPNQGFRFGGWEENGEIVNTDPNWSFYTYLNRTLKAVFEVLNAPVNLATSALTPESFTVTWQSPADNPEEVGVAGYNVYLDGNLAGTTTEKLYSFSGLTEGTAYTVTVEAFSSAGSTSSLSTPLALTTPIFDIEAPSVPTGLAAINAYSTTTEVAWQPSIDAEAYRSGVESYTVYLDGNLVAENVSESSFFFTGLTVSTGYNFSISAKDSIGNISAISSAFHFTTNASDVEAPTSPSSLVAFNVDFLSASVGWNASTDNEFVVGYNVYLDGVLQGSTETTSFSFSGLRPDRNYNVEVEAYDLTGNTSAKESFSLSTAKRGKRIAVDTEEEILFFLPILTAGDSLIIKDGVYELDIQFISNKKGTATAPIVVMSENLYGAQLTGRTRLQFFNAEYLKFIGLNFVDVTQFTGLRLLDCNYTTISQCSFTGTTSTSPNTGVRIESNSPDGTRNAFNTIENCLFENIRDGAMIRMRNNPANVGGNIIRNNVFRNSSQTRGNALLLFTAGNNISNSVVEGNVFNDWVIFDAINVQGSNNTIRKNVFTQTKGIIFRSGNSNTLEQNQFLDIDGHSVWLHGDDHVVINNTFEGGNSNPIRLTGQSSNRAVSRNNLIAHNTAKLTRGFLYFIEGSGEDAYDNTIVNNVASLNAGQFILFLPEGGAESNTIDFNVFHNVGSAVSFTLFGNNIGEDPLIGDAPYYLFGEGSSAIGSGSALAEVTTDIFGNPRVNEDRGHITYPSDISEFVSPYMFYPPNTSGNDALPLEAIFEQYNASETTGDVVMLDAIQSTGEFGKYRWTVSAYPSGAETVSAPIDESVYSFVFDDAQFYSIKLELLDEEGNVLAATTSELKGANVPVAKLKLTSMCSENPYSERRWRVRNSNPFPVDYEWEVYGTEVAGSGTAEAGDSFFTAIAFSGANTTKLYWLNEKGERKNTTKASGGQACDPNFVVEKLKLTSMCSDDPSSERRWRVRNPNTFSVKYRWEVHATDQTATLLAAPGDSFFLTETVGGANTTKIKWQDETGVWKETVKASGGAPCNSNMRQAATIEEEVVESRNILDFALYPNPANDVLHIESEEGLISIFSIDSMKVMEERVSGSEVLNIEKFQSGLYLIKFQNIDNQVFIKKIVIE